MLCLLQGFRVQERSTQMFKSRFGPDIEDMLLIRRRAGYQLKFIDYFLSEFDSYCADNYPKDSLLTREIAEGWIHATTALITIRRIPCSHVKSLKVGFTPPIQNPMLIWRDEFRR